MEFQSESKRKDHRLVSSDHVQIFLLKSLAGPSFNVDFNAKFQFRLLPGNEHRERESNGEIRCQIVVLAFRLIAALSLSSVEN